MELDLMELHSTKSHHHKHHKNNLSNLHGLPKKPSMKMPAKAPTMPSAPKAPKMPAAPKAAPAMPKPAAAAAPAPASSAAKPQGKKVEEDIVLGGSPYGFPYGSYDPWAAPFSPEVELTPYPSDGLGWAAAWDALNIPEAGAVAAEVPETYFPYGAGFEVPAYADLNAWDTLNADIALDSAYPFSDVYGYGAWGSPVAEPYLDMPDYTWIQ